MEKDLQEYISWYRDARNSFVSDVYIDRSSWWKEKLLPYSNWNSRDVIDNEIKFSISAMAELTKKSFTENTISLAALALSNRVEYASDQADFYATYAGLTIFALTVIGLTVSVTFKAVIGLFIFGIVLYSVKKRLEFRQEIAICKEMINLFKQYESKHA